MNIKQGWNTLELAWPNAILSENYGNSVNYCGMIPLANIQGV